MKKTIIILFFLILSHSIFGLNPKKNYEYTPKDLGLNYYTDFIEINDSCKISTWRIFANPNCTRNITIIISSSDSGNMTNYLFVAASLSMIGYEVILYDYRGFGESSNFEIDQNKLFYNEFVTDLSVVVEHSKQLSPLNKICLIGYSIGSLVNSLYLFNQNSMVDYCIFEGFVFSPIELQKRLLQTNKNIILPNLINQSYNNWEELFIGQDIPFLIFIGNNDLVCNTNDIPRINKMFKNFQIVEYSGGHLTGAQTMQFDYFLKIDSFLSKK